MSKVEIYNVTGNLVKSFDYTITVDQTQINLSELNQACTSVPFTPEVHQVQLKF